MGAEIGLWDVLGDFLRVLPSRPLLAEPIHFLIAFAVRVFDEVVNEPALRMVWQLVEIDLGRFEFHKGILTANMCGLNGIHGGA